MKKECCKCRRRFPLSEQYWYRSANNPSGFQARCKRCNGYGDAPEFDPNRPRKGKACRECEGMSWRRHPDGCVCGGEYEAEAMPSIEDAINAPRDYSRMVSP